MTPHIAPFEPDRIHGALALWRATEHIGLSAGDAPEELAGFLAHNPGLSHCAAVDGLLVGTILCGSDGRRGYIHHLAVADAARGQRVARRLVDACLGALRARGIRKCHAFVFLDNAAGAWFWEAAGWERRQDVDLFSRWIEEVG